MKKRIEKIITPILLVGILFTTAIPVAASYYFSQGGPKTVTSGWDGREYSGQSVLIIEPDSVDGGSYVGAGVDVIATDGNAIARSYIRAEPRLYLDGELLLAEGWHYSDGTENGLYAEYFTYFFTPSGNVFAQSVFGIYNGTGYTNYTAPKTATKNIATVTSRAAGGFTTIQEETGVNANGQTYGSGWVDETPDLIKAVGAGGIKGYVYNADLLSLGDRTSLTNDPSEIPDSIPLYAVDGVTVIGEFLIGCPNE